MVAVGAVSAAVCVVSVFSAMNQIKYSIMKIAVCETDGKVFWVKATKEDIV